MIQPVEVAALPRNHARGIARMLLSTACFTATVLLIRALGEHESINVWMVTAIRFAVGLVVLAAFYWRTVEFSRLFTRSKLASRGIVGGIGVYAYYLTVIHLGAGRATFINNTYIMFGAVMAVWILGESFRGALAIGGVAALTGLALLTNAFGTGFHANIYDAVAVACALASAYVVVTIRLLHAEGEHTTTIFAAQCVYGLLICGGPALWHPTATSTSAWLIMIAAGICAAAGQLAMTRAFRDLPVGEGALLQIIVPLGVAAGGWLFFHEQFTGTEILGAALVLAGTAFSSLRRT